jgi:MFS family permease
MEISTEPPQDEVGSSYQQLSTQDAEESDGEDPITYTPDPVAARRTMLNFIAMSILFSANHGSVVSCMGLATARLGSTGAWQSGILFISYTASALLGATYITKRAGSRKALFYGMALYCIYVGFFWLATLAATEELKRLYAWTGAGIGGIGAGFLWTSQGAYFGQAAEEHARQLDQPVERSTAYLAGIFAFFYLAEEVVLRLLSSFLLETQIASWETIFGIYTLVSVLSILPMPFIRDYSSNDGNSQEGASSASTFNQVTVAGRLLIKDPKMKYMIGLNAVFGFTSAFLGSYVNGEVLPVALNDQNAKYVGVFTSWTAAVAAGMSLVFGKVAPITGRSPILIVGAMCFFGVVFPFLVQPDAHKYNWESLLFVYTMQGIGRATFEGTLKATFADFFSYEKEGAFANIILQNGLAGAIGYICMILYRELRSSSSHYSLLLYCCYSDL